MCFNITIHKFKYNSNLRSRDAIILLLSTNARKLQKCIPPACSRKTQNSATSVYEHLPDFSGTLVTSLMFVIVRERNRSTAGRFSKPTKHALPRVIRELADLRWGRSLKGSWDKHEHGEWPQNRTIEKDETETFKYSQYIYTCQKSTEIFNKPITMHFNDPANHVSFLVS